MNWDTCDADVVKILNKHYTKGRGGHKIDKIVLHHNGGNLSVQGCWNVWQSRAASAHYQVCSDGTVGQLVWDRDTAWHAGNWNANQTSIGIEHADESSNPWRISNAALESGAHLTAALCKLYKLGRPEWGKNVFGHSNFASTECPASLAKGGSQHDAYMRRAQEWYDAMCGKKPVTASTASGNSGYHVKVTTGALNIRKGPGTSYAKVGQINDRGIYTIVAESSGKGATLWGKLKSGAGWISLDYAKKV